MLSLPIKLTLGVLGTGATAVGGTFLYQKYFSSQDKALESERPNRNEKKNSQPDGQASEAETRGSLSSKPSGSNAEEEKQNLPVPSELSGENVRADSDASISEEGEG